MILLKGYAFFYVKKGLFPFLSGHALPIPITMIVGIVGSMIIHLLDSIKSNVNMEVLHAVYPNGIVFILFFIFNALYYTKSEIHSGS
ncbi:MULTISPECIES: hypothetical protein [unclassified Paenibacillus]|uniref:hypothetical protein n=1 Tax=unclassified Paenibacillus TaxID=185978 RepID=UPI0036359AA6